MLDPRYWPFPARNRHLRVAFRHRKAIRADG